MLPRRFPSRMIQKGARSPHTLYPLKIFNGTQPGSTIGGRHVLAEPETLRRCLHFTPEFHKCYSSARLKKRPRSVRYRIDKTLQWFYIRLQQSPPPCWSSVFGGEPMTFICPHTCVRRIFNHQSLSFVHSRWGQPMRTLLRGQLPIYNLFKPLPHMKSTKRFVDVTAFITPDLLQIRAYPTVRFRVMVRKCWSRINLC
jgi:hypothetical protein